MKRIIMLCALVGLTLACAFGQEIKIKSKGALHAEGEGQAKALVVTGTMKIKVKGVFAIAPANIKVTIQGKSAEKTPIKNSKTGKVSGYLYKDVDGIVTVTGEKYLATVQGAGIKIDAEGAGKIFLIGSGKYTATDSPKDKERSGSWLPRPTPETKTSPAPIEFGVVEINLPEKKGDAKK